MSLIKIAGVQMDIQLANANANLATMQNQLRTSVSNGAQLTIFPECTTTGYCFETFEEAFDVSETVDGQSVSSISNFCAELKTHSIFGFLEKDENRIFNSVVCVGPTGMISKYRKVHLPTLGVDNFTTPGDNAFEVFDLKLEGHDQPLRIGMNICYDCSFPESARVLTLLGADLIALPTNWPPGSGLVADVIPNTRALENNVYFAAVNRIGTERGFDFIGKSKICDPLGRELDFANHCDEAIVYGEIDVAFARRKHLVAVPGKHEVHRIEDRRPDTYGEIVDGN
jgi:predicted amidohydrolase